MRFCYHLSLDTQCFCSYFYILLGFILIPRHLCLRGAFLIPIELCFKVRSVRAIWWFMDGCYLLFVSDVRVPYFTSSARFFRGRRMTGKGPEI